MIIVKVTWLARAHANAGAHLLVDSNLILIVKIYERLKDLSRIPVHFIELASLAVFAIVADVACTVDGWDNEESSKDNKRERYS